MKNKVFYGWRVCIGCALLLFCTSGLSVNAFNVYQPYIISENGFTNTQSSLIITFRSIFCFVGMFLTGIYYRKIKLRTGMFFAGTLTVISLVIFGFSNTYFTYILAAIFMGLGYGLGSMIPIQMVLQKWFINKRSFAIGLCSSVTGLSTLGIPTLLTYLIENYGLSEAFYLEGAGVLILIILSALLIRNNPQDMGLEALQDGREKSKIKQKVQKVILKKQDWILIVIFLLFIGAQTNVGYSHLSVLMKSQGFDPYTIALAISVSGVCMTLSKILFGFLSQYINIINRNRIFGLLLILGYSLLCLAEGSKLILFVACIVIGFGFSLTTVGKAEWEGDFCSDEDYAKTVRIFNLCYSAGGIVFSTVPGILADHFNGSYIPAYILFTFCSVFIVLSVQFLYRFRKEK